MTKPPLLLLSLLLVGAAFAGSSITEGGNVTDINLTGNGSTKYWAGIVGDMDIFAPSNPNYFISYEEVGNVSIYENYPNGTYYNISMVVTRLGEKPPVSGISSPTFADISTGGMFSNFTAFNGLDFTTFVDSPFYTFLMSMTMNCTVGSNTYLCPYVTLIPGVRMGLLKYSNGTHEEPIFITVIENQLGYNGSYFDFEYMVPKNESYYFYVYPEDCNITIWIDGAQTTIFPKTGVPYDVRMRVVYPDGTPVDGATFRAVEENGRSILSPNLYQGRIFQGSGYMIGNSAGEAIYALTPTRYNVPDSYGYISYVEVTSPAYCRTNFSIAQYNALTPTYRTSLVNAQYGSQVKSSVQNMNSLASTASKWIYARKMRNASVTVTTAGAVGAMPTLKAGAPNYMNISVTHLGSPVTANLTVGEKDGHVMFVPAQPDKYMYNSTGPFLSNETFILIPTNYNNDANLTIFVEYGGSVVATLHYTVDHVLEDPAPSEMDMDDYTNALIGSAVQNINLVLSNVGKSISTV